MVKMEFQKARHRQKLLDQARGGWRSCYFQLFFLGLFVAMGMLYAFNAFHCQVSPAIVLLPMVTVLDFMLNAQAAQDHRYLDALMELMDVDRPAGDH